MSSATGLEMKAALKQAGQWGTAVSAAAGDGVLVLPPTLKRTRQEVAENSLGEYFPTGSDAGEIKVDGDIPAYLRYEGVELLLALALGQTDGVPVQQGATAAFAQGFDPAVNTDGLFGTFALDNGVNVDEYPSVKVTGFTLKGEVGQPLRVEFHCLCDERVVDSVVNTQGTMSAVTCAAVGNRVLMSQGAFRLNERDGAALDAGDEVYPSSFELTFKRAMKGVYAAGAGADTIDEPTNNGQPEIKLKLTFPRYTGSGHFASWNGGVAQKLDMTFTGSVIEAPYARTFTVQLPNLRYAGVELPVREGIAEHPLEFLCLAAQSAPAGMQGITAPLRVDVINTRTTDVLA